MRSLEGILLSTNRKRINEWREHGRECHSSIRPPFVDRGVYQLHIYLPRATTIEVGRWGTFRFPAGWYVYTGSAMGGLEARVRRHLRREKKLKWHVDYLLQHAEVHRVVTILVCSQARNAVECRTNATSLRCVAHYEPRLECAWNERTLTQPGAKVIVERFGSSDCRCASHLIYFGRRKPPFVAAE